MEKIRKRRVFCFLLPCTIFFPICLFHLWPYDGRAYGDLRENCSIPTPTLYPHSKMAQRTQAHTRIHMHTYIYTYTDTHTHTCGAEHVGHVNEREENAELSHLHSLTLLHPLSPSPPFSARQNAKILAGFSISVSLLIFRLLCTLMRFYAIWFTIIQLLTFIQYMQ